MDNPRKFKLGIVINPFAGIGGALALKGSDGEAIREQALAAGAKKLANDKMRRALNKIYDVADSISVVTASREMGEDVCRELGLSTQVVYSSASSQTEAIDTENAVREILKHDIDLLLFAGGDGTARNICHIVEQRVPVLGVPAGCKIHSGVYAVSPPAAGEVLKSMVNGDLVSEIDAEVRDIDETAFRQGKVIAKPFGEMRVPNELTYIQAVKAGGKESEELVLMDIAAHITNVMDDEEDTYFVMGSGSTVASIMEELGLQNTLLGVDVVYRGEVVKPDATANDLIEIAKTAPVKLVITVIGGQGHIFGRGNQQISPDLIREVGKENILIVATKNKLNGLAGKPLRLDTSDEKLDEMLAGQFSVITGYNDKVLYPAL